MYPVGNLISVSDLDQLLTSLSGVGQLNSRGEFTLDASRAALLLEKYQLPSAAYFMLHAVGAALASGATSVEATVRKDLFELVFDGEPFSPEDASECVASLWLEGDRPEVLRLQELAIARGGAQQWGAHEFSLEPFNDGRQRLRVPRPGWMNRLTGRFVTTEDLSVFLDHLVPTPQCQFHVNGKPLAALTPPSEVVSAYAVGEDSLSLLERLPPDTSRRVLKTLGLPEGRGIICQLPQTAKGHWENSKKANKAQRRYWPGFMDVVLNGRLYRCPLPPEWQDWWGVFYLGSLKRDLSFSYLAERDLIRLRSAFEQARDLA